MPRHLLAAHGRHVRHDDDHVSLPRVCDVVADGGQLRARGQERRRVVRVQQAEEGDGQTVDVRRVSRRGGRHAQSNSPGVDCEESVVRPLSRSYGSVEARAASPVARSRSGMMTDSPARAGSASC